MVLKTSHEARSLLGAVPLLAATRGLVPQIVVQFSGGRSDWLVSRGHRVFKGASAALLRLCDGVLVLSSEAARDYEQFWPRGSFQVVADPFLPPADENGQILRPENGSPLTLLFVGRVVREKGIYELLTGFAAVNHRQACHLLIVGDGRDKAKLTRQVAALGLDEAVTLTGYLTGQALLDAYRRADVFVLPSYREGFPRAITEALAAGLPVVTTKTGGIADHLAEDNALFVQPRDGGELANALDRILSDTDLRNTMAAANRDKVGKFAPDVVAKDYLAALRKVTNEGSCK
jgi:glycosyltransferase involved in cell wall biosynthesis